MALAPSKSTQDFSRTVVVIEDDEFVALEVALEEIKNGTRAPSDLDNDYYKLALLG